MQSRGVVRYAFRALLLAIALSSTLFWNAGAGLAAAGAYTTATIPTTAPRSFAPGRVLDLPGDSAIAAGDESDPVLDPTATGADLRITASGSADLVRPGDVVTYTIAVRNNGPSAATDVSVTHLLPPGVAAISATPSQGVCPARTPGGCTLGSLAVGEEATIEVVAEVSEIKSCDPITSQARVIAKDPDPDTTSQRSRNETEVTTAVEGIAVATDASTYFITGDRPPQMPTVTATAQLCGTVSSPPTDFALRYEVHYNPSKHASKGPDRDISFTGWSIKNSEGPEFTLDFGDVIRGGELSIVVNADADGRPFRGGTEAIILGGNPSRSAAKAELDLAWAEALGQGGGRVANNYTLWRIAQQESGFRQFVSEADLPWYEGEPGYPKWNVLGDGGAGMMQVTPPKSDEEIWDWTRNVRGGVRQLLEKVWTSAQLHDPAYPWSAVRQPGWAGLVATFVADYNQHRQEECDEAGDQSSCWPELKPEDVKLAPLSRGNWNCELGQRELNAIRLYNGVYGTDPNLLPTTDWLNEYTVELEDGLWDGSLVVEVELDGNVPSAIAKWRRITGDERTRLLLEAYNKTSAWQLPGDPNYVEKVLDKSEAVGVCRPNHPD